VSVGGEQGVLLRDVINIPERISASDFVLQLHEGVSSAERTLGDYVVTESIAQSFGKALGLVKSATDGRAPKGAFVHGSFGSGKSHFMAVLHLLLIGNTTARALPGLQEAVAANTEVLGKRFLVVDYHLLGKESFEAALFAGFLEEVARRHPEVRAPVLHRSDALFADAVRMRHTMGDEGFFAALSGRSDSGDSGWGDLDGAWDAASFDAAVTEPVGGQVRTRLMQDLIATFFAGYTKNGEWLEISEGLKVMTKHTRDLGYDGLVLFLDELVLWLGQHLSDSRFIQTETSKVAKLVETEMASLPVPIVSFVARQRDLKDFLGGGSTVGAEQVALGQSFQWWEGRFDKIELRAADLPKIVHQRLLLPKDAAGAAAIQTALAHVKANPAAWRFLLTDEAGSSEIDFGQVYPFSPALVDALVALSSLLQRERTALKVLSELLIEGRDQLTVNDVIPVGDLFDIIVLGDPPLTDDMKRRFKNAATFYRERMRPHLLGKHHLTEETARALPRTAPFRTEDRLAKTLLVAELAPGAASLKNLTASKLAALNFGSVRSMLPGQEAAQVVTWVDEWSRAFGEITKGQGGDPIISITLAGVDYDSVVERVANIDQPDARRTLIRDLLITELGLPAQAGLITERVLPYIWRGSKRDVDVIFGNVRDPRSLPDEALRASSGRWKVVIDYPFDEAGHSPSDDYARLGSLTSQGVESDTIAWIPYFFTSLRMEVVGRLVLLEYVLQRDRFDQNSSHLAVNDREPARQALENQRRSLREQVVGALRQAYAIATPNPADVEKHVQGNPVFATLHPGLVIAPPVAVSLRSGLEDALGQALTYQFPAHPEFEPGGTEVRRAELATVLGFVQEAVAARGRIDGIERTKAALLRRVAGPLGLGTPRENVYALAPDTFTRWGEFTQWAAAAGGAAGDVKVADLRARLASLGLVRDVEDLLILTWSLLDDREWARYGTPTPAPGVGGVSDDMVLRLPHLPAKDAWDRAVERAERIFGVSREHRLSVTSLARLAGAVRAAATGSVEPSKRLVDALTARDPAAVLGLDPAGVTGRLGTAKVGRHLVVSLSAERDDSALIELLAASDLPDEPQPLARSLATAASVSSALAGTQWDVLASARALGNGRGEQVLAQLAAVAASEELHAALVPGLATASSQAHALVLDAVTVVYKPPASSVVDRGPVDPVSVLAPDPSSVAAPVSPDDVSLVIDDTVTLETRLTSLGAEIRAAMAKQPGKRLRITWRLE